MTDKQRKEIEAIVAETDAIMHPTVNDPDEAYFQDKLGNLWVYAGRRDRGMIAGTGINANGQPIDERLFEPKEIAFLNT